MTPLVEKYLAQQKPKSASIAEYLKGLFTRK
jgi:hypothetical protein